MERENGTRDQIIVSCGDKTHPDKLLDDGIKTPPAVVDGVGDGNIVIVCNAKNRGELYLMVL